MGIQTYSTIEVDSINGNSSTQIDVLYADQESDKIRGISINGVEIRLCDWIAIKDFVNSKMEKHWDETAKFTKKNLNDAGFDVVKEEKSSKLRRRCRKCNNPIENENCESFGEVNGYCLPCYHANGFPPIGDDN